MSREREGLRGTVPESGRESAFGDHIFTTTEPCLCPLSASL